MAGVSEPYRRRLALVLIIVGAALILLGFVAVVNHQRALMDSAPPKALLTKQNKALLLRFVLFWGLILFLGLVISTYAFLRWSRRFRKNLTRRPRPPTPADDVWAMHKLPEGAEEDWGDPLGDDQHPTEGPSPGSRE